MYCTLPACTVLNEPHIQGLASLGEELSCDFVKNMPFLYFALFLGYTPMTELGLQSTLIEHFYVFDSLKMLRPCTQD